MDEIRFRRQVDTALEQVKKILEVTRLPVYPADVHHKYDDKYHLAEILTNAAAAAQINCLEFLGLTDKVLATIIEWSKSRSVTIRLTSEERCNFAREETRKETSPTVHETKITRGRDKVKIEDKVVTTITEYFWTFSFHWSLFVYQGNNALEGLKLGERKGTYELKTSSKVTPRPEVTVVPPVDVNVTWLVKNLQHNGMLNFKIDRTVKSCRTPRRNVDVERALQYFVEFRNWANAVERYIRQLLSIQVNSGSMTNQVTVGGIFVPVIPLFEEKIPEGNEKSNALVSVAPYESKGPNLSLSDVNLFLNQQKRSIIEKFDALAKIFPENTGIASIAEARLLQIVLHSVQITEHYNDGINYIEDMLQKQLIAAIGKIVTPVDFANYMKFHNRRLFKREYEPIPFCYAIRRPDHYPEGTLSIEAELADGSIPEPATTIVRSSVANKPMLFPINAATNISFVGDRHLHAMVLHEFSGQSGVQLNLVARTRQFSSFILLVGTIVSTDIFQPKIATIIQNKDDLKIPLLMEQIPTPKEFKDAIESLSPEQQRFAKAFRSMQLASTLFGIVVIQIKPQLERLLKLPYDSLTKEIRLTQDLMELFIKYQIPSDLITYDGNPAASTEQKLQTVKQYVRGIYDMIHSAQKKELEDAAKENLYSRMSAPPPPMPVPVHSTIGFSFPQSASLFSAPTAFGSSGASFNPFSSDPSPTAATSSAAFSFSTGSAFAPPPPPASSGPPPPPPASSGPPPPPGGGPPPPSMSRGPPPPASEAAPSVPQPVEAQEIVEKELDTHVSKTEEEDYTQLPKELDRKFEVLDEDSALRPTIIKPGKIWNKQYQKALLAAPSQKTLQREDQRKERENAYDLLDALSRSGSLPIEQASLHVVMAATHCFDKSLLDTVIKDNINPIEKVERSTLIVATTIQNKPAVELINYEQVDRVSTYSPLLFEGPPLKKQKLDQKEQEKILI